eukprot:g3305.t1
MVWAGPIKDNEGKEYYVNQGNGEVTYVKPENDDEILPSSNNEATHYSPEKDLSASDKKLLQSGYDITTLDENKTTSKYVVSPNAYSDIVESVQTANNKIPWYIKKIARNPCQVIACSMGSACFLVFLLLIFLVTGIIEFQLDTSPDAFNVKGDDLADRYDAQNALKRKTRDKGPSGFNFDAEEDKAYKLKIENETKKVFDTKVFSFYYEVKNGKEHIPDGGAGGNIFDAENIQEILDFENKLLKMTRYQQKYCARKDELWSNNCLGYTLSPRMFGYSTSQSLHPPFKSCCECNGNISNSKTGPCAPKSVAPICVYNSAKYPKAIVPYTDGDGHTVGGSFTKNNLDSVLTSLALTFKCKKEQLPPGVQMFKFFFEKKYSIDNPKTSCSRSILPLMYWINKNKLYDFEAELKGLSGAERDEKENTFWNEFWHEYYRPDLHDYVINEIKPMVDEHNAKETTKVRISFFGPFIIDNEVISGTIGSAQIVAIAILIVLFYIIYHTGSIFLGCLGQLHVVISFPVTWFLYRCVFQYKYMSMLNFTSMFIIIGIGADDIFVFIDAWQQALLEGPEVNKNLETRLNWAWNRAAKAMLITSLTDAAAFYINIVSIVIVVRNFGIFMGTIILINYLLVITWYPSVVVVYTKLWPNKKQWKPRCKSVWPCWSKIFPEPQIVPIVDGEGGGERVNSGGKKKGNKIEIFFNDFFAPKLFKDLKTRSVIALLFAIMIGIFLAFAFQIKASEKDWTVEVFPNTTNIMRSINVMSRFEGERDFSVGEFLWGMGSNGMKAVNREGTDTHNPWDFGKPVFDENFNPYTTKAQQHVIDTCNIFRKNKHVRADPVYKKEGGVYCFMEHFRDWVIALNYTFPVPEKKKFNTLMARFTDQPSKLVCNAGNYPANESGCVEYYETIKNYPSTLRVGADNLHMAWRGFVRWRCPNDDIEKCDPPGDIAMYRLYYNVSIKWDKGAIYARPIADDLEKSMIEANELAGEDFVGFQFIRNLYVNMRTQEIMYTASFIGASVSCVVAFVVLTLSTMNILIAAYAMINISFIVICCIGFMVVVGWQLGTIEGILVTICIGFSVDFVVHIAIAYVESDATLKRYEKTKTALAEMGISVLGATLTTG